MGNKLIKYITKEEFESIFNATNDKKLKLALLLGFEAGMRISEIIGLHNLGSICCNSLIDKKKIVREKDNKKITHYYCSKCHNELTLKQMKINRSLGWEIQPLTKDKVENAMIRIIGGKGQKDRVVPRPKRMNEAAVNMLPLNIPRRTLQYYTEQISKKIIKKKINFHMLRHGFGSHLAGQNRPLHEIQMLMGHSRLDTTGLYLHANPKQAVEGARDAF